MVLLRPSPKSKGPKSKIRGKSRQWTNWPSREQNVTALGLIAAVVVSPWAIRNYRVFGKPIVSTTHGGIRFIWQQRRHFYRYLRLDRTGLPWDPNVRYPDPAQEAVSSGSRHSVSKWILTLAFVQRFSLPCSKESPECFFDRGHYESAQRAIYNDPWTFAYPASTASANFGAHCRIGGRRMSRWPGRPCNMPSPRGTSPSIC